MKVALTHDVDRTKKTYQYISQFLKALKNRELNKMMYHSGSLFSSNNPYWNFNEIIKLENDYGVKSTFFFLNETIRFNLLNIYNWQLSLGRYNILDSDIVHFIKYLDTNGWEIGLHGSYYSFNNKPLLKREKKILEDIVGHKIIGTRQHYLNMNDNTWEIQQQLGLKYDSTWGFTKGIGFKEGKVNPFRPFDNEFVVFPLAIMDVCFMMLSENERWVKFFKIIEQIEKNNAILVLNWHQRVFNEKEFPNYLKEYKKILEYLLKNGAIFDTLGNYYKKLK